MWASGSRNAAQFLKHNGACARIGLAVFQQLGCPVRAHGHSVDLESQSGGFDFWIDVAGLLRFGYGAGNGTDPLLHDGHDAVANHSTAAVELERGGAEETSPRKDPLFDQNQPLLQQAPQARHALGRSDGRPRDFFYENLASHFDGRQLKFFLGTEMGKETALAHVELFGERTDSEPFEALDRGNIDGAREDSLTGAKSASLGAGGFFFTRGTSGLGHVKSIA